MRPIAPPPRACWPAGCRTWPGPACAPCTQTDLRRNPPPAQSDELAAERPQLLRAGHVVRHLAARRVDHVLPVLEFGRRQAELGHAPLQCAGTGRELAAQPTQGGGPPRRAGVVAADEADVV